MDILSYIFSGGVWFGFVDNGILLLITLAGVSFDRSIGGKGIYGALFGALIGNALSDLVAAVIDPATRDIALGIFMGCIYVVILAYGYVKIAKPKL